MKSFPLNKLGAYLALFAGLSLATASLASIYFGTVLLNYMAYYVARVIVLSGGSPLAVAMAWHPWSMLRVAAFVVIGVVLAEASGTEQIRFEIPENALYGRVTITSSRPHPNPSFEGQMEQAWTQPVGWQLRED